MKTEAVDVAVTANEWALVIGVIVGVGGLCVHNFYKVGGKNAI